jgi:hypothetical protein
MSIQEAQMLQDLLWLLRSLHERVSAIEERLPTWLSGCLPDIAARLGRLDRVGAAIGGSVLPSPTDPCNLVPDPPQAADPPGLAVQPVALRAAIADILQQAPGATGPDVLARLRETRGEKLPALRTVRWHLQALRGNGSGNAA